MKNYYYNLINSEPINTKNIFDSLLFTINNYTRWELVSGSNKGFVIKGY